jgi:hypothetical protein
MDERISNLAQVASLRRYTLTEGREKGLDVIDCDNGKIRFLLNVNKACDVMQMYHKGQNMSFISKNGFSQREISFGARFEGGMLYTCGLDSVGEREGYDEHGSIHNAPAQILRAECNEQEIVVEAVIRDTEICGKNLVLRRQITAAIGGDTVSVRDVLTNEAYRDENYCLLYHVNIGYPMLDDGAKIVAQVLDCQPRTDWAAQNIDSAYAITAPTPNMEETCYYLKLKTPQVSLVNEKIGKKFTVSYSGDTLPEFLAWKSMASGDYAVGLEPCTTKLDDLFAYSTIQAGQTLSFSVDLTITEW